MGYPVVGSDPESTELDVSFSVTAGRVVSFVVEDGVRVGLRTDASADSGNSGGPALTDRGEVAGVVTALDFGNTRVLGLATTRAGLGGALDDLIAAEGGLEPDCTEGGVYDDPYETPLYDEYGENHTQYGDHPVLDAMYDRCRDADIASCVRLINSSPVGSEYQTFAASCGTGVPSEDCVGQLYAAASEQSERDLESTVGSCILDGHGTEAMMTIPCDQPHEAEIMATVAATEGSLENEEVEYAVLESCLESFEPYVGVDYWSSELEYGFIIPGDVRRGRPESPVCGLRPGPAHHRLAAEREPVGPEGEHARCLAPRVLKPGQLSTLGVPDGSPPGRAPWEFSGAELLPREGSGSDGDEVDQLFHRPDQVGLEVGVGRHRAEDQPPQHLGLTDIERPADAGLPVLPHGNLRPGVDPEDCGADRLPDVDVGVAGDQHVGVVDLRRQPRLLGSGDQMIEQDPQPATRASSEPAHCVGQIVGAVQRFDHDALDPEIVAPDVLDQLGVVDALDPDPAGPGHPRRRVAAPPPSPTRSARPRRRPAGAPPASTRSPRTRTRRRAAGTRGHGRVDRAGSPRGPRCP